jgi:hypothetical protein
MTRNYPDIITYIFLYKASSYKAHNDNSLKASRSSQILPKIYSQSYEEFNTEFCKLYMPKGLYL